MSRLFTSDEPETEFFGTFGLSMFTSPTTSLALKPLQFFNYSQAGSDNLERFIHRELLYLMPFGRAMYSAGKVAQDPAINLPSELFALPTRQLQILKRRQDQKE